LLETQHLLLQGFANFQTGHKSFHSHFLKTKMGLVNAAISKTIEPFDLFSLADATEQSAELSKSNEQLFWKL